MKGNAKGLFSESTDCCDIRFSGCNVSHLILGGDMQLGWILRFVDDASYIHPRYVIWLDRPFHLTFLVATVIWNFVHVITCVHLHLLQYSAR